MSSQGVPFYFFKCCVLILLKSNKAHLHSTPRLMMTLKCHHYEFQPKYQGERIGQDPGKSAHNKRTVNKKTVKAETLHKQSQDTRKG